MSTLNQNNIQVVTRDGTLEPLDISIVRRRLEGLSFDLNLDFVNLDIVVHKVQQGVHDRITTAELDSLSAETCAYMVCSLLFRTSFTRTTASSPPASQWTTSENRPKHPFEMWQNSFTTARTSAVAKLHSSTRKFTRSSAITTSNLMLPSTSKETLALISSASKHWKGHTCSRLTDKSWKDPNICSCGSRWASTLATSHRCSRHMTL